MYLCIWFSHGVCLKHNKNCVLKTGDVANKMLTCLEYEADIVAGVVNNCTYNMPKDSLENKLVIKESDNV